MSERPWRVTRHDADAAALHALEPPPEHNRQVWVCTVVQPALVLGSTQDASTVRVEHLAEQRIDLVRRRSGGGAVLLVPGEHVWIDVLLARHDPLVLDDMQRSFHWLGDAWVRALAHLGHRAVRHDGPLLHRAGAALVCFGGLGPGEVLLGRHKVVGLSQRRTRDHVRFQCLVHQVWRPADLLACFESASPEVDAAAILASAVPAPADELISALLSHLPT